MTAAKKTHVTFQSDVFNRTEQRDNFVNPDCFGEDVCNLVAHKVQDGGIDCEGPIGEDWGWSMVLQMDGRKFVFGTNYHQDGFWLAFVQEEKGLLGTLFGIGNKGVPIELTSKIHEILIGTEGVQAVRWFDEKQFNQGEYDAGSTRPE